MSRSSVRVVLSAFTLVTFVVFLMSGCQRVPVEKNDEQRLRVIATTTIVADAVKRVGGTRISVHSLMGPGVDPHLYKASEGDVLRIAQADIVFYHGLHLEARMGEVLEKVGRRVRTVAVTRGLTESLLLKAAPDDPHPDPHIWFDVHLWKATLPTIAAALSEIDPASSATYEANARQAMNEFEELDVYVRSQTERIPPPQRVLITAHDAFRYFGRAYGFEVIGLQGISTASEAGARDIDKLAQFIVSRRIRAIFVESSVPYRTVQAVQQAVRARGATVQIGGELYSDALGTPGSGADTYPGMVQHNINTIVKALLP